MTLAPALQWAAFGVFSIIAVAGALGMTTTMGMFRSGIFLMASFFGVAGLFILLAADLLGWLQVMMYVGGMLVMILFMVLFSADPGGDAMASMMKLAGPERFFSRGLARAAGRGRGEEPEHAGHDHGDGDGEGGREPGRHDGSSMGGMSMDDMSMFTPVKRWAIAVAGFVGAALAALFVGRATWPVALGEPPPEPVREIGHLLMGKYMLAFEAAGLLILLGVFGGVFLGRPGAHPGPRDREHLRAKAPGDPPSPEEARP